jgi:hypothetical protein
MRLDMKKFFQISIPIIFLFILFGCNAGRYTSEFKKTKKQIDTLSIFKPYVKVNTYRGIDSSITNYDRILITGQIFGLLNKKYKLINYDYDNLDLDELYLRSKEIESTKGIITDFPINTFIDHLDKKIESRYALIVLYTGSFNTDFEPDYNLTSAIINNTIVINSPAKVNSDITLIIIDTISKEIKYYNHLNSSSCDPRKDVEISGITQRLLEWFSN